MLNFRFAVGNDVDLYYKWVNDIEVRRNSLSTEVIKYSDHLDWFSRKIGNPNVFMYLFVNEDDEPVGQVRIEKKTRFAIVGQSIGKEHRGKKYGSEMLLKATDDYLSKFPEDTIVSVVKKNNYASYKMAVRSGFNCVNSDYLKDIVLVLKGKNKDDIDFIEQAVKLINFY